MLYTSLRFVRRVMGNRIVLGKLRARVTNRLLTLRSLVFGDMFCVVVLKDWLYHVVRHYVCVRFG